MRHGGRNAKQLEHAALPPRCRLRVGELALAMLGVLAVGLVAACGTGASTARPAAPVAEQPTASPAPLRLTLNWTAPSGVQVPLWLAYERGIFREMGLEVELVHIATTSRVIQAMAAGEVHLSPLDPATAVRATLGGAETVLLLAMTNHLNFAIMSQPSIQEPQALLGKTLGVTRIGASTHTAALVALRGWGLVPDRDVSLRQLGEITAIPAALEAGQIDAGVISQPADRRLRAVYPTLLDLAVQGPEYPSVAIGGPRAWVASNEEAVRRFTHAYVLAVQQAKRDKALAIELFRQYMQVDDAERLEDIYVNFSHAVPDVPYVSEVGFRRVLDDLMGEEPRLAGRQPAEFIDSRFVRELEAAGFFASRG